MLIIKQVCFSHYTCSHSYFYTLKFLGSFHKWHNDNKLNYYLAAEVFERVEDYMYNTVLLKLTLVITDVEAKKFYDTVSNGYNFQFLI